MQPVPPVSLKLLQGTAEEIEQLQRVLDLAPTYSMLLTGAPAHPQDAHRAFSALPPNKTYEDKFLYGIYLEQRMIGCIDVIREFPSESTTHIGLLLIEESLHRRGYGQAAHALLEAVVKSWIQFRMLRIGVVRTNEIALEFWHQLGYVETGEVRPYNHAPIHSETVILERRVEIGASQETRHK
jgi:RimJ/RimL family protein N-acetyltransferase